MKDSPPRVLLQLAAAQAIKRASSNPAAPSPPRDPIHLPPPPVAASSRRPYPRAA